MTMATSALRPHAGGVSSDIFDGLFDSIFNDEAFKEWREGKGAWQLHCIGGPGSGKTTLTAVVSRHLEEHFKAEGYPIVTLQIHEDVLDHETDIVEDLLEAVYHGLVVSRTIQTGDALHFYAEYRHERYFKEPEGCRRRKRLDCLRRAVHTMLTDTEDLHAYLILDGIDRCGSTLRFMLETELYELQNHGMSILLTSRLAIFETDEATCDHHPLPPEMRPGLRLYLECTCGEFVVCYLCARAGKVCAYCDDECVLEEPYKHVNLSMSIPSDKMAEFIAWDLEREHGDLGLHSPVNKPPLSRLGKSLLLNQDIRPIRNIVDDIVELSYFNVGIAKARLDLLHDMESLEGLDAKKDQLPTTVTALFDYGLERIETLPERQRAIAFKAIAAAGHSMSGIEIPELRHLLEFLGIPGVRSGEDIIEAAGGWLVPSTEGLPLSLQVYHSNFLYYVKQRYNQGLHRSSIEIEPHIQRKRAIFDADLTGLTRFEPQNVSETPAKVTPYKLARTVTAMPAIDEAPAQPFIIRKGTVAWT